MADTLQTSSALPHRSIDPFAAVGAAVQQTWWFALGLVATVVEQAARAADALVEKGREIEPTIVAPVRRAASEVSGAAGGAGARLKHAATRVDLPSVLHRAAAPTKEEFEKLAAEVRELRARLGEKIDDVKGGD